MNQDISVYIVRLRHGVRMARVRREFVMERARQYHDAFRHANYEAQYMAFIEHTFPYQTEVLHELRHQTHHVHEMIERIRNFKVFAGGYLVPAGAFSFATPHYQLPPIETQIQKPVEQTLYDALQRRITGYYWLTHASIKPMRDDTLWQLYVDGTGKLEQERFVASYDLNTYYQYFVLPELRAETGCLKKQLQTLSPAVIETLRIGLPRSVCFGYTSYGHSWHLSGPGAFKRKP
jgi:hypothetical protein